MIQAILLIILSIVVIAFAIIAWGKYKKISTAGTEAEGIIFDMDSFPGAYDATITYPIVRFLTEKNEWITQKASVSIIPGTYKKGQKITVVYLKDNPTDFFIKSTWSTTVFIVMIFIGLFLTAYGTYALISSI
jgi:hypothetical protein